MRDRKRKRAIQSIGLCNKYFALCFCDFRDRCLSFLRVDLFFNVLMNLVHRTPYGAQGLISTVNHKHPYLVGICLVSICFFFFNLLVSICFFFFNFLLRVCILNKNKSTSKKFNIMHVHMDPSLQVWV